MYFPEYKEASIRHLDTCCMLCDELDKINNNIKKKSIIHILYYLTGYVIESIVTYAIYDFINYNRTEHVRNLVSSFGPYNISFRKARNTRFCIQFHDIQNNVNFFNFHNISGINDIPFIGIVPTDPRMNELFKNWDPEIRYTSNLNKRSKSINILNITESEIKSFVDIAIDFHLLVRTRITRD